MLLLVKILCWISLIFLMCPGQVVLIEHGRYSGSKPLYGSRCLSGLSCNDGKCIDTKELCDGRYDCLDKSDEDNCVPCRPDETACYNGQCVKLITLCNGERDCPNGEDESFEYCLLRKCPDQFICQITRDQCVDNPCGPRSHCRDHSDRAPEVCAHMAELQTKKMRCDDKQFMCRTGGQCINSFFRCDGHVDCNDGSDEFDCNDSPDIFHDTEEFVCSGDLSIPRSWVCDQKKDCPNGDDELLGPSSAANCSALPAASPDGHQSTTGSGYQPRCLLPEHLCDGLYDCEDYSDELPPWCNDDECSAKNQFACRGAPTTGSISSQPSPQCIPPENVCDGKPDCPRGDDELEGPRTNCTSSSCSSKNGGCSQICEMPDGSVKCSCFDGYTVPVDSHRSCVAIGDVLVLYVEAGQLLQRQLSRPTEPYQRLHVIDRVVASNNLTDYRPTLQWLRMTSAEAEQLHSPLERITAWSGIGDFDYDYVRKSSSGWPARQPPDILFSHRSPCDSGLYLTTARHHHSEGNKSGAASPPQQHLDVLHWAAVGDPTGQLKQQQTPADPPLMITFDWVHRLLYWSNASSRSLHVGSVKPPHWRRTLLQLPSGSQPLDLLVDPRFARLYFIDQRRRWQQPAIVAMDMDGQNRELLVTDNLTSPYGLGLDFTTDELYWADGRRGSIESVNLRSRVRRLLVQSDEFYPVRVGVFEDWVYWTDRKANALLRANKNTGTQIQELFQLNSPFSFHLQHELLRPAWVSRCQGHLCQQLCLPVPLRSYPNYSTPYVCACADGWTLDTEDRHTCHKNWPNPGTGALPSPDANADYWTQRAARVHRLMAAAGIQLPAADSVPVSKLTWLFLPLLFAGLVGLTLFGLAVTLLMHYRYQRHVYESMTGSGAGGRHVAEGLAQSAGTEPVLVSLLPTGGELGRGGDRHRQADDDVTFHLGSRDDVKACPPGGQHHRV